jgi:tetratricopeptide (TPR) repeat protein
VLRITGRYDEALVVLEQDARAWDALSDLTGESRAVAQMGRIHHVRGTTQDGVSRIEPLLQRLWREPAESRSMRSIGELSTVLAHVLSAGGRYPESAEAAAQGADAARGLGDERLLAEAQIRRGTSLIMAEGLEHIHVLENILPLAERVGQLDILGRLLFNLGICYAEGGEIDRGRGMIRRHTEIARREGDPSQIARSLIKLADLDFAQGNWDDARVQWEQARDLVAESGGTRAIFESLLSLRTLGLWEGTEDPQAYLRDGAVFAETSSGWHLVSEVAANVLEHSFLDESTDEVLGLIQALLARVFGDGQPPPAEVRTLVAQAHVRLGDPDQAQKTLSETYDKASDRNEPENVPRRALVRAMILAHQRQWVEADASAEEALALARRLQHVPEQACVLHEWGRLLKARGEREKARERLQEALSIFRRLGAQPHVECIEREARDLVPS